MKKGLLFFVASLLVSMGVHADPVTGVDLNPKTAAMVLGTTPPVQLTPTILPATANQSVTWVSRDATIASVSPTGLVTAVAGGSTWIVVETVDGGFKDSCKVTITDPTVVTSVSLDKHDETLVLVTTPTVQLTKTILPATANQSVTWVSRDATIASVSPSGLVTAVAGGTTWVVVETVDGGFKDSCKITVNEPVTGITLGQDTIKIGLNEINQLTYIINPANATNQTVTWTSVNPLIATVSASGLVTGKSADTTKVAVKTTDGNFTDTCVVVVSVIAVDSVVLNKDTIHINAGTGAGSFQLITPTVYPATATNKTITWKSLAPALAEVSATGVVTGKKAGQTWVVALSNNDKTDTCVVHIYNVPVNTISLHLDSVKLSVNDSTSLDFTILPSDASNQSVIWSSVDSTIAKVTATGMVKALKAGKTKVVVETVDGSKKDTCVVTVLDKTIPVTGVSLNRDSLYISVGNFYALIPSLLPANATNKHVTWESTNNTILNVSDAGVIAAKKAGVASVVVFTADGNKKDTCVVTVSDPVISTETDETKTKEGVIEFVLDIPANSSFTGSFMIQFPAGVTLDMNKTQLTSEFAGKLSLNIVGKGSNTWQISVKPKANPTLLAASTSRTVIDIVYMVAPTVANGTYNAIITNANLILNNATVVKEDYINVPFKIRIVTSREEIEGQGVQAYLTNNELFVSSPQAETIYLYSLNGTLLAVEQKAAGEARINIPTQEPVLIVKGSSGWVKKVAK